MVLTRLHGTERQSTVPAYHGLRIGELYVTKVKILGGPPLFTELGGISHLRRGGAYLVADLKPAFRADHVSHRST